jgi:predicted SnoaL-like aldol condensation-catalyzing enzyme
MNSIFSTRRRYLLIGALIAALGVCAGACSAPNEPSPKEIVIAFYELGLQDLKVEQAFARYMSPDFVEHAASSAGGRMQSTIDFLSGLIQQSPPPRWEIVRTIAEGDLVFVHARVTMGQAPALALGEIFRVRGGKIVEHWDILQPTPEHPINPNSMF